MRIVIGCLAALLYFSGMPAALAAHTPPSNLVRVCKSDQEARKANCAAFLRGAVERLEIGAKTGATHCRTTPFGSEDVSRFLTFTESHMVPDDGEAFVLAVNFWANDTSEIPCDSVAGYWTAGYLAQSCAADDSDTSACKFYIEALVGVTQIEAILRKEQYFCPKGDAIRRDDEVRNIFRSWIAADPRRAQERAALAFIDDLKAAYPC